MILLGRLAIQCRGSNQIVRYAARIFVRLSECRQRNRVPLTRGTIKPRASFPIVLRHTLTALVAEREVQLSFGQSLLRSLPYELDASRGISIASSSFADQQRQLVASRRAVLVGGQAESAPCERVVAVYTAPGRKRSPRIKQGVLPSSATREPRGVLRCSLAAFDSIEDVCSYLALGSNKE